MTAPLTAPRSIDAPIRTAAHARSAADAHAASGHDDGPARAAQLRKWSTSVTRAKRHEKAGDHDQAGDAWRTAEHRRQYLADLGVTVPTRDELNAPPAPPEPKTPGKAGGASSPPRRPSPRARSGSARSPGSLLKGAAKGSGVSGIASSGWSVASAVFVGSVALILLMRLVNERQGGPQVVQFAASGVSRAVDLIVNPVDPFKSAASTAPPAAVTRSGTPYTTGTIPAATSPGPAPTSTPAAAVPRQTVVAPYLPHK